MAGVSGRFVTLIPQVRTSSKTLVAPVSGASSITSFSAPPFTAAEGGPKGCSGFGSKAGEQCTARPAHLWPARRCARRLSSDSSSRAPSRAVRTRSTPGPVVAPPPAAGWRMGAVLSWSWISLVVGTGAFWQLNQYLMVVPVCGEFRLTRRPGSETSHCSAVASDTS